MCDRNVKLEPRVGDSAVWRGKRWTIDRIERHLSSTDISYLHVEVNGRARMIVHVEWAGLDGWRDHERGGPDDG